MEGLPVVKAFNRMHKADYLQMLAYMTFSDLETRFLKKSFKNYHTFFHFKLDFFKKMRNFKNFQK